MPAPDRFIPVDPLRYLVGGVGNADRRNTVQENDRAMSGWVNATLENSFAAPSGNKIPPRYRLHFKTNSLEIDGHVDVVAATSGTVAFTLLQPFWRDHDISYSTHVVIDGVYTPAHVAIDSTNGEVSLYWE